MIRSRNVFVLCSCSRSLSSNSHQLPFPSQHRRALPSQHSLPVAPTVAAPGESPSQSSSIASGAQNQQEQRSSQHGITQNLATFLADRVFSTVNAGTHARLIVLIAVGTVCNELSFLSDSPPIPVGDQLATPIVQYPRMLSDPVSNPRPSPATARARGDSLNDMTSENMSGARARLIDSWIGNAETVLKFVSPIQLILCLLSYSFCLKERCLHSNSRIVYN